MNLSADGCMNEWIDDGPGGPVTRERKVVSS